MPYIDVKELEGLFKNHNIYLNLSFERKVIIHCKWLKLYHWIKTFMAINQPIEVSKGYSKYNGI